MHVLLETSAAQETPQASIHHCTEIFSQDSGFGENGSSIGTKSLSRRRSLLSNLDKVNDTEVDDTEVDDLFHTEHCFEHMGDQFDTGSFEKCVDAAIDDFDTSCDGVLRERDRKEDAVEDGVRKPLQ
jgi:hypothetical protein